MNPPEGGDVRIAGVHLARSLALGGTVYLVGDLPAGVDTDSGTVRLIPASDAVETVREGARSGDAAVVLGAFPDRDQLLARLPAWGVAGVWVGEDRRPGDGDATVCLGGEPRDIVPHLLAIADELRHDPAALTPAIAECTDEVCVTCSDEGRLGEVVSAPATLFAPAVVRTADGLEEIDVTILGRVNPGDLVVIHAGMGIALVPLPAVLTPDTEELAAS